MADIIYPYNRILKLGKFGCIHMEKGHQQLLNEKEISTDAEKDVY